MSIGKKISFAILVALLVAAAIWVVSKADGRAERATENAQALLVQTDGSEAGGTLRQVSKAVGEQQLMVPSDLAQLSPAAVSKLYESAASCAMHQRMSRTLDQMRSDKSSWLNDDQARASLTKEQLDVFERNISFVEQNRERCSSSQDGNELARLYSLTLVAANKGNASARACYLRAPWSATAGQSTDEFIASQHKSAVPLLLEEGIRDGDWQVVNIALSGYAANNTGLMSTSFESDPKKALLYAALREIGAKPPYETEAATTAAALRSRLGKAEAVEEDRKARELFDKHFRNKNFSPDLGTCDF